MAGDFVFMCINNDKSLAPIIMPGEAKHQLHANGDGTPVESSIPKDIIVEIYKVVGNYRRQ